MDDKAMGGFALVNVDERTLTINSLTVKACYAPITIIIIIQQ